MSASSRFQEDHPQMPRFIVKRVKIPEPLAEELGVKNAVKVVCGRPECGRWVILSLVWFKINRYMTRPCPYCFKAGVMPERPPKEKSHG